jgi:hypothetical protein
MLNLIEKKGITRGKKTKNKKNKKKTLAWMPVGV